MWPICVGAVAIVVALALVLVVCGASMRAEETECPPARKR